MWYIYTFSKHLFHYYYLIIIKEDKKSLKKAKTSRLVKGVNKVKNAAPTSPVASSSSCKFCIFFMQYIYIYSKHQFDYYYVTLVPLFIEDSDTSSEEEGIKPILKS